MVTEMDCCPGDLMLLLDEARFLPFLATLVLFNSFYISEVSFDIVRKCPLFIKFFNGADILSKENFTAVV